MFKFFKKQFLGKKILSLFQKKVDEETLENLERLFFEADLGVDLSQNLVEKVTTIYRKDAQISPEKVLERIKEDLVISLKSITKPVSNASLHVILIVGANGNGKTTTVGKLAAMHQKMGKKVLVAAADTFRAAAVDQLDILAKRLNCDIVKGKSGGDAASVVFDALQAAKSREVDLVIIDTAGRLHTKTQLMQELEKIYKVANKVVPTAPHETLLVLDATTGKNAIDQGKIFNQFTPLTGIILSKIDGTAKGGVVLSLQKELNVPVRYLGTGEELSDFKSFEPQEFVDALFE